MSYKGMKAEIKIINPKKFIKNLPINLKNEFNGNLYYDEQGYGNLNSGLTFKRFGGYFEEISDNLRFDMSNNLKYKECKKEFDEYNKTVDENSYNEEMIESILHDKMIGEECEIHFDKKIFNGTIIDIGSSHS